MKRKYIIGIDGSGVDELLEALEKLQVWLKTKAQELLDRLASEGFQIASAGFSGAEYDGTNDVSVSIEDRGETTKAVVAVGSASLFIEFGTGVKYQTPAHPEAGQHGMIRGGYGHGLGRLDSGWRYPEENGAGTGATQDPDHPGYLHTYGNPANMPMYKGAKHIKERLPALAREVFSGD